LRPGLALFLALVMAAFALLPGGAAVARDRPANVSAGAATCGDFLAQLRKKPPHVAFVSCTAQPARQGKPLRALYRVSGVHAARTEALLIKSVGLARLKHSCCQWDAPPAQFRAADGRDYAVSMVSAETSVARRVHWRKIARFEIIVETLTEDI
jgi:hypothetical protein